MRAVKEVEHDFAEAAKWYHQALEQGESEAQSA